MAWLPQSAWIFLHPPHPVSFSLFSSVFPKQTHAHTNTSPNACFPGRIFWRSLQVTLNNGASVSLGRHRIHKHCLEFSSFLSSHHSDAKEKTSLLSIHCMLRQEPFGPVLSLGCPTCTEGWGQFDSLRWCFQEKHMLLKYTASHKWNLNSCPSFV